MSKGSGSIPALMIQGTGSDVGKSILVAALCRAYRRRGLAVRPFKPQNMSNNAAVTADGGEIGRAQALQARACGLELDVHMNPVLLKPETDTGAQVVVQGRVVGTAQAGDYQGQKPDLMPAVLDSFGRISERADLVLVEGAGSPAEVNLRRGDIANMGFAVAARVPVVLLGDIDRGGVIASLVGTKVLLSAGDAALIKGFLINKFRGDLALFDEGLEIIEDRTGWPSLGVIPFLPAAARLPAEDAVSVSRYAGDGDGIKIAVPMFSRIANFDDLDPLAAEPDVTVEMVPPGQPLPADAHLVLLPGTKSSIGDLAFLRAQGWDVDILAHRRRGGHVLGICGGYQILGVALSDPDGVDGAAGEVEGLGLLEVETRLAGDKTLEEVSGNHLATSLGVRGFEMHVGQTTGADCARPMLDLGGRADGAVSTDGKVAGCYVHGLFAADDFRHAFLAALRARPDHGVAYEVTVEAALDELAEAMELHADLDKMLEIARLGAA